MFTLLFLLLEHTCYEKSSKAEFSSFHYYRLQHCHHSHKKGFCFKTTPGQVKGVGSQPSPFSFVFVCIAVALMEFQTVIFVQGKVSVFGMRSYKK